MASFTPVVRKKAELRASAAIRERLCDWK